MLRMYVRNRQSQRGRQLPSLEQVLEVARTDARRVFGYDHRITGSQRRTQRITLPEFGIVPRGKHGPVGANYECGFLVCQLGETAGLAEIPACAPTGPEADRRRIEHLASDRDVI